MAGQKTRFEWLLIALAALMLTTVPATAKEDTFSVVIGPSNNLISGNGTGYNST